ncbi:hypothetical protein SteCoe_18141 [Stentor coeruleus]|uniref:Uncharacterized protein n=1 Tax=Stentor coeruleus TaxID=5963 RepID=A0A1R2BXQ1_9CILI|nr:hypothetical protein SteCoe_18141 [Stentor coeruleus]
MEDEKSSNNSPKPIIISRNKDNRSNTYAPNRMVGKISKKRVVFVDRVKNAPLCTVFNYEQVDIADEDDMQKSTSCACFVF